MLSAYHALVLLEEQATIQGLAPASTAGVALFSPRLESLTVLL